MNILKTRTMLLLVATLAFGASAFAQPGDIARPQRMLDLAMMNFRHSLKSDIPGVVEGTILDVVVYKKFYPSLDYDEIVSRLNELAINSKIPSVGYKAHLASMYFAYGTKIEIVPDYNSGNEEDVFKQISEQLEKKILASETPGSTVSVR